MALKRSLKDLSRREIDSRKTLTQLRVIEIENSMKQREPLKEKRKSSSSRTTIFSKRARISKPDKLNLSFLTKLIELSGIKKRVTCCRLKKMPFPSSKTSKESMRTLSKRTRDSRSSRREATGG